MIYAIRACGANRVKFGKAKSPAKRIKELSTGSPYHLCLMAAVDWEDEIERLIHAAFKKQRVNGEWFEVDDHVKSFVSTMMCPNADDAEKFGACMQILVEMLTGWSCHWGLEPGTCRAHVPEGMSRAEQEAAE